MNTRTKSALLLLATLLVGLLVGGFATSTLFNHRVDQIRSLRERGGFTDRLGAVIEPTDAAQEAAIQAVLVQAQARFEEAHRACGEQLAASRTALRDELNPLLTPAQQARLDAWFARDRPMRRRRPGPDGSPRGPEGRRPPEHRPPR